MASFSSSPKPLQHWKVPVWFANTPPLVYSFSWSHVDLQLQISTHLPSSLNAGLMNPTAKSTFPLTYSRSLSKLTLKIQHAMPSWSQKYALANHPHLSKCQLHFSNCFGQNPWRYPWLHSQSHPTIQPINNFDSSFHLQNMPRIYLLLTLLLLPKAPESIFHKQPKWSFRKSSPSTIPLLKTFQQLPPHSKSQNPYGGLPRPHDLVLWLPLWPHLLVLSPQITFQSSHLGFHGVL